jgi:hypothetical protein
MLTLREQQDISSLYLQIVKKQINEMGLGPVAMGEQPVGKPVQIELEIPSDEDTEEGVDRSDIDMACSALHMTSQIANELLRLVKNEENLPGWMSSKITLSFDYLSEVYSRLKYKDECECISNDPVEVNTVDMFNIGASQVNSSPALHP